MPAASVTALRDICTMTLIEGQKDTLHLTILQSHHCSPIFITVFCYDEARQSDDRRLRAGITFPHISFRNASAYLTKSTTVTPAARVR